MQSRESIDTSAQMPSAVQPPVAVEESVDRKEVSYVFHCMQCDLQFQMDMAMTSHKGSHEIDAGVIRVRLDPRIRLEREGSLHYSSDAMRNRNHSLQAEKHRWHVCSVRARLGGYARSDRYVESRAEKQDGSRVVAARR